MKCKVIFQGKGKNTVGQTDIAKQVTDLNSDEFGRYAQRRLRKGASAGYQQGDILR